MASLNELIFMIYKYGFIVCLLFSAALGFIILTCRSIIRPFFSAKLGNNLLECKLNNDGSGELSPLKRYKGVSFNKDGEPVQEYKRMPDKEVEAITKEYNEKKLKNTYNKKKIKPLFYHFANMGGVKIGFRREGDLTFIDETGKPSPIDQAWIEKIFNIYYSAIMKLKKLFKKKAKEIPLWIVILIVIVVMGVFMAARMIFFK